MRDIASLTGQRSALAHIRAELGSDFSSRLLVEGPPGCGKSWLLRALSQEWTGSKRPVFTARGDRSASARALSPFHNGLAPLKIDLQLDRLSKSGVAKIGSVVPIAGSLLSFLLEACFQAAERKQRSETPQLNAAEQEILFQLQHVARKSELLLIVDDLQHWDLDSLRLLKFMLSSELAAIYPFLTTLRVVACRTIGPRAKHEDAVEEIVGHFGPAWQLNYCSLRELPAIMEAFGLRHPLTEDQTRLIYTICAGHLELIRRVTDDLSATRGAGLAWSSPGMPGLDAYALLNQLVSERLGQLGDDGVITKTLLTAAAVIGTSCSRLELQCLLKWDDDSIRKALVAAEQFQLLESNEERLRFLHEDLRECFFRALGTDARGLHQALGTCLAVLRPSDYFTRAEHALFAGHDAQSAQLYFAGLLQRKREHCDIPEELLRSVLAMMDASGNAPIATAVLGGYELFFRQQYTKAVSMLENIEHTYPSVFRAERDYLLALCLLKSFRSTDSERARNILEDWDHLKDTEKEVWYRIQLTLLVAYVHLGQLTDAAKIERRVARYLDSVAASDPGVAAAVNILRRKASSLYGAEISTERCRKAADYFGTIDDSGVSRNPAQLYMALCNLAGNLIVSGSFSEAVEVATRAARLAVQEWPGHSPRPEVAINNVVVAGFLAGTLSAAASVQAFQQLLAKQATVADRHLILNNHVVVTALTGRLQNAVELCSEIHDELRAQQKDDSYYQYFVGSNLAGLMHLTDRSAEAIQTWNELGERIPQIPPDDRAYLLHRHRLQRGAFEEVPVGDVIGWHEYLLRKFPVMLGDGWRFFGRGLLLTDIQFWSES
jgi:Flp pilus assembly protein TadD